MICQLVFQHRIDLPIWKAVEFLVCPSPQIRIFPDPADIPDHAYYPWGDERIPHRLAIVKTNRLMVRTCDILIAYAWHPASSARDLVEYAQSQGKTVINLGSQRAEE